MLLALWAYGVSGVAGDEARASWAGVAEAWADLLAGGAEITTEVVVVAVIVIGLPVLYGVHAHRRDRRKELKP